MQLLTKQNLKDFDTIGSQEGVDDPLVIVKFFCGNFTWYATEYNKEAVVFFGYVKGQVGEFGYFGLGELESIKSPFPVERDLYCGVKKLSEHLGHNPLSNV